MRRLESDQNYNNIYALSIPAGPDCFELFHKLYVGHRYPGHTTRCRNFSTAFLLVASPGKIWRLAKSS